MTVLYIAVNVGRDRNKNITRDIIDDDDADDE
jgi:hypothetical protein